MEIDNLREIAMNGLDSLKDFLENNRNLIFETFDNSTGGITVEISTYDECMGTDFLCGFEFDNNGNFINEY